jgi:uncharacterized protein YciI
VPLFAWIGYDGPLGGELRTLHREAHLANLAPLDAAGKVVHAGPLLGEDGTPLGSLILFEAPDLAAAKAFAAQDPYVVGGVFARYEVRATRVTFPRPRI